MLKKVLGNTKMKQQTFSGNINKILGKNKFGASFKMQNKWKSFDFKKKNFYRKILKDTDRDRVPDIFDCQPFNRKKQDSMKLFLTRLVPEQVPEQETIAKDVYKPFMIKDLNKLRTDKIRDKISNDFNLLKDDLEEIEKDDLILLYKDLATNKLYKETFEEKEEKQKLKYQYLKEYQKLPEIKERKKQYRDRPEIKKRIKYYEKIYRRKT